MKKEPILYVPAGIQIAGKNEEKRSAFVLKPSDGQLSDGLFTKDLQIMIATRLSNQNTGMNYFLNRVKQQKPRANTLVFRTDLDIGFNTSYSGGYRVFDGEKFGYWEFNDAHNAYDLRTERLDKSEEDIFFEVVRLGLD